jgi:hypothetical protein
MHAYIHHFGRAQDHGGTMEHDWPPPSGTPGYIRSRMEVAVVYWEPCLSAVSPLTLVMGPAAYLHPSLPLKVLDRRSC